MFCTFCGAENPEYAKFCRKCGARIDFSTATPSATASRLVELSEYLAASFVMFSGKQSATGTDAPRVAFENMFDMVMSGFMPRRTGFTLRAAHFDQSTLRKQAVSEVAKEELFAAAYKAATAFVCLYSDSTIHGVMRPEEADQFASRVQSSVARLCAGQFGFDSEPRTVFAEIQKLMRFIYSSKAWLEPNEPGKDDCFGKILSYLSLSPDGHTRYAFDVGSEKQPLACAGKFIEVMLETRRLFGLPG